MDTKVDFILSLVFTLTVQRYAQDPVAFVRNDIKDDGLRDKPAPSACTNYCSRALSALD